MDINLNSKRFASRYLVINSLIVLIAIVASLFLGELFVRISAHLFNKQPLVVSDSHAGWKGRPGFIIKSYHGGKFSINTDSDGQRKLYPNKSVPPTGTRSILLIGDSFVQGVGVNDDETFGWILARHLPYHFVNLGAAGYGTDQELIRIEKFFEKNTDTIVRDIFVFVYENDFFDIQRIYEPFLCRSKPGFGLDKDKALIRPGYHSSLADKLMDLSRLFWVSNTKLRLMFTPHELSPEPGVGLVIACLRSMQELCDKKGVNLHILAHHHLREPLSIPPSLWSDFLMQSGAIDITERIRTDKDKDPVCFDGMHWSTDGHKQIATLIKEELRK